jgi:hypothetical protein
MTKSFGECVNDSGTQLYPPSGRVGMKSTRCGANRRKDKTMAKSRPIVTVTAGFAGSDESGCVFGTR